MLLSSVSLMLVTTLLQDVSAASTKLPSSFEYCKRADPEIVKCLTRVLTPALIELRNGIPGLGVPSLDPMDVTAVEVPQGQGPVSLKMKFSNIRLRNLSKAKIESGSVQLGPKMEFLYTGGVEKLEFESDYEMNGRILVLPVTGKGRCHLTFHNLYANVGPKGSEIEKNGKKYFNIEEFITELTKLDKLELHFDNLFEGDKALGDNMNLVMNDNWQALWEELKPIFVQTFKTFFLQYSKAIFDKVPLNEILEE